MTRSSKLVWPLAVQMDLHDNVTNYSSDAECSNKVHCVATNDESRNINMIGIKAATLAADT